MTPDNENAMEARLEELVRRGDVYHPALREKLPAEELRMLEAYMASLRRTLMISLRDERRPHRLFSVDAS